MKTIGILFGDKVLQGEKFPFSKKRTNQAYQLLSEIGKQKEVRFLISDFKHLENNTLKKAWVYDETWQLVEDRGIELIFDRSETNRKNDEKKEEINKKVRIINSPGFNKLCWDKVQTYDYFSELVPRTFEVNNINELKEVLPMIGTETVVLKPRYGIMGKDIKFVKKNRIKKEDIKKNFVVQQFIDSSAGIKELDIEGVHDLRIIIINGKIDHSYVRTAEKGSLFANCARGGKKVFLKQEQIPDKILEIFKDVDSRFGRYLPRIYSIDLVYDKKGKIWISELESIPGFAYYEGAEEIRKKFLNNTVDVLKEAEPVSEEEIAEQERLEEERRKEAEEKRILLEEKHKKLEQKEKEGEIREEAEELKEEEEKETEEIKEKKTEEPEEEPELEKEVEELETIEKEEEEEKEEEKEEE
jgi:glutathione synthase/RimK-type ligase-like ATP-grasp enzyme